MPRRASTKPRKASLARQRLAAALVLGGDCTLRESGALKKLLLRAKGAPFITIDGGAVERIDAAGLQLLAALAVREATRNRCLRWCRVSDELRATARRAGLVEVLKLDAAPEPPA